jgi:hypothetical protein
MPLQTMNCCCCPDESTVDSACCCLPPCIDVTVISGCCGGSGAVLRYDDATESWAATINCIDYSSETCELLSYQVRFVCDCENCDPPVRHSPCNVKINGPCTLKMTTCLVDACPIDAEICCSPLYARFTADVSCEGCELETVLEISKNTPQQSNCCCCWILAGCISAGELAWGNGTCNQCTLISTINGPVELGSAGTTCLFANLGSYQFPCPNSCIENNITLNYLLWFEGTGDGCLVICQAFISPDCPGIPCTRISEWQAAITEDECAGDLPIVLDLVFSSGVCTPPSTITFTPECE